MQITAPFVSDPCKQLEKIWNLSRHFKAEFKIRSLHPDLVSDLVTLYKKYCFRQGDKVILRDTMFTSTKQACSHCLLMTWGI